MAKYRCLGPCHKNVIATTANKYRKHDVIKGNECPNSGESIPAFLLKRGPETEDSDAPVLGRDYVRCPECSAKPALERDARITQHGTRKDEPCPASGRIYEGGEEACEEMTRSPALTTTPKPLAKSQTPDASSSQGPAPTAPSGPTTPPPESPPTAHTPDSTTRTAPPTPAAAPEANPFAQPGSPFSQPAKLPKAVTAPVPMTEKGAEIAARLREIFYAYSNRMERNVQETLGPSEIGTPCDRRIALSLMRVPRVNPGGDNWASFVGTCVHEGLADMFMWADANKGRYAVEVPLTFPSPHVPKGTSDLLDRVLLMVDDHKLMGTWSLDKLRTKGPSPTYRVQGHVYAYGQRLKGEKVERIAVIGWPRQGSNLDDLYVWTEPYDPSIARDALARVDRIAGQLKGCTETIGLHNDGCGCPSNLNLAMQFPIADDCRFCPFYAPGDSKGERGCNGKR
jgi:hypothetical protein